MGIPSHPSNGSLRFMGERVLFSRYLGSADWRPVRRCPKGELHALVTIASPIDVASYHTGGRTLVQLDVSAECASQDWFGRHRVRGTGLWWDRHTRQTRLVRHGAQIEGEQWLWLEDEAGKSQRVAGSEFTSRVRELRDPPAFVVVALLLPPAKARELATTEAPPTRGFRRC